MLGWFQPHDIIIISAIALLEGFLSVDNALVLALIARELPKNQQRKALTYGLLGAVAFRLLALKLITSVIQLSWTRFIGGTYLIWLGGKHLLPHSGKSPSARRSPQAFWRAVILIELTDIVFALDSIVAAVAISKNFWVVFAGGALGIVMMRLASNAFIVLLRLFPRLETIAYLLVLIVGLKLFAEGLRLSLRTAI